MTIKQYRDQLLSVIDQATDQPSLTNPLFTKGEIHRRLLRQTYVVANEEGQPADSDLIKPSWIESFNKEFKL
jgi:hypothetical protein